MLNQQPFYGLLCFGEDYNFEKKDLIHPELHLNLWEHDEEVSLDIGLKIHKDYPVKKIHFYFPWKLKDGHTDDLTLRIVNADAIATIFNESWHVSTSPRCTTAIAKDPITNTPILQVLSPSEYWSTQKLYDDAAYRLTIDFFKLVTQNLPEADFIYLRFRINHVLKEFYCVGLTQSDHRILSSWSRTEIIDFRLNVRRGAPPDLERTVGKFICFSKVHLFLMRDRSHELIFEDATFKSCRSLEDEDFWTRYTQRSESTTQVASFVKVRKNISNSLGYQWSKKADEDQPVNELKVLARFKHTVVSVKTFLVFAFIIGAGGNAVWDFIKYLLS